jgi:hypothetical protein
VPSATVNDTAGNVFQPDSLFRGFIASPVAGTPQGLAVYVDGARFNDAFGDTVNWDLIPPTAIDSINLEASNPVFALAQRAGRCQRYPHRKPGFAQCPVRRRARNVLEQNSAARSVDGVDIAIRAAKI